MPTIELLDIDWRDRENARVVRRIPAPSVGDAVILAKSLLDDITRAPPNAYQVRDEIGEVVARSWDRSL
jgi:hypothetical protein